MDLFPRARGFNPLARARDANPRFIQLQFPFLLQRRPGDHFERVVWETSGCDGDRLSHGGSNIHVHTAVVLRGFLPLPLLRQHDLPRVHVRHVIQGRQVETK